MNEIKEKHGSNGAPIRSQRATLEISNKIYPVYDGINTIGRNPNAVINIKNITISQHHAVIVVIGEDKHFISDVKSSNGTFLNCNCLQPLSLYELHDKDLLRFGEINAIYRISSNGTNTDIQQIEAAASQSMSQNFYLSSTQNVEDFHEMDTEVFDINNENANFHDLPTQIDCFNEYTNQDKVINNEEDTDRNASPLSENIRAEALIFSESLNKNSDPINPNIDQAKIDGNNENTANPSPLIITNDDTSNESIVLVSKNSFDQELSNQQIDKIDEPVSNCVTNEAIGVINEQLKENIDESSNESLDLATMQKVTPNQNKFHENFGESQQIRPVTIGNSSRRIFDSDNSNLIENDKKQASNDDDETDIEDNDVENESSVQTENKNDISNESDLIPATQDVNLKTPQASGIIDESFDDSSFALEISDNIFESSNSNRVDDENQPTQQLNITLVMKHKNYDNIDELYLEPTQKIENNAEKINEQPEKDLENAQKNGNNYDLIDEQPEKHVDNAQKNDLVNEQPVKDVGDSVDQLKSVVSKDNSGGSDLFILPESPKKAKRTKSNIVPKSSISKEVEDELQHMFATQQENFTCSQLVNILADSPIKQNTIQINDNDNNNNKGKTSKIQDTVIEKSVPKATVVDQKVEQELETIFQSQQDLTCSQLVRILDEPKDVKNSNTVITMTDSRVENCEKDSSTNSKETLKENNNTRTLRRKFSKLESDKEMEVSKSYDVNVNEEKSKSNKRNLRKRSVNSNTDSQSSIVSVSNESSTSITVKDDKETSKRKLKKDAEMGNKIENTNRRITRNSQSSIDTTSSSEEFLNTSKLRLSKRKRITKNDSNEQIETVESINNNNNGEVLRKTPRKRTATAGDDSNIPTKVKVDQSTIISNKEVLEDAQMSDTSVSESTNTSIKPSITNQKNKMSRRTRKNPNNSTLLLPVTVSVPKNEENIENTSIFTRTRSSKNHTIPTSDASSSPSLSISSTSPSSVKTKRSSVKKGARRLSANSRSLKNLEKIEQNENETKQKDQNKRSNVGKNSNIQENINQELNQSKIVDTPEKSQTALKPKVVFTMMDDPELESIIKELGGKVIDNVKSSTVLVTKHVKRSAKLLSAVGQGIPICSPQWLLESKKASQFLDPWDYILKDNEAEEKWKFKLHESLERSNRKKLMENYTFQLFVNEAADVLKGAIESCGGKCVARNPLKNCNSNFIIVANPENQSKYNRIIKQKPDIRVVAPEAIFDGTLRQELQFERHLLL